MEQNIKFSIVIPARDEERYIGKCLESIEEASKPYPNQVEVIVVINRCTDRTEEIAKEHNAVIVHNDSKCLSKIRNAGAREARGEILITIDADSTMSPNMLTEIDRLLNTGKYIGGGVKIIPERISVGIFVSMIIIFYPLVLLYRISGGLFWCYRKDFIMIGGFDESIVSAEDIDFALRLKAYGKKQGKRFKTIRRANIRTSCRKFDKFGDWFIFRNPKLFLRILQGKNQKDADELYYDIER